MTQQGKRPPKGARRKGYTQKSPAVCMVVHDLGGRPVSDKVVGELLDSVTEIAVKYGYVINFTTQ